MSNIDLKGRPFYLNDSQIEWVKTTKEKMTIQEKIGQLFFLLSMSTKQTELKELVDSIHPGGIMYRTTSVANITKAYTTLQENSSIPMLLAANLESGGNGLINEGTFFGHPMQVAASGEVEQARRLGQICAREANSVGANMAFAPIIDINYNWRNPITNIRSFGDDPAMVAAMGAAYVKGALEEGLSMTIKHFPGDGTDGRDQHLVLTPNQLSIDDWRKTFGAAYKASIEEDATGLMVGHISLPSYFEDGDPMQNLPGSLNPALLNNLLRDELGFNGLTMTDASIMTGFGQVGKRADLVPQSIAAGCDMFLFTRMPEDDFDHMMNGYKNGVITEERLDEALTRILAMKAHLKLHTKSLAELVPNVFDQVAIAEHKEWAAELADKSVTLVKDSQNLLPLKPNDKKRIGVMYQGNEGMAAIFKTIPGLKGLMIRIVMGISNLFNPQKDEKTKFIDALNAKGFEAFEYSFGDIMALMDTMMKATLSEWKEQFDVIIFLVKRETESNKTSLQLEYKAMGFDAPWWVGEVPTMLVSLGSPYHQYDLPMIETVVNAYSPTDEVIQAVVDKITGESEFKGISPVNLDLKEFTGKLPE